MIIGVFVPALGGVFSSSAAGAAPPPLLDDTAPITLRLTETGIHDATLQKLETGEWEIQTTGTDPYVFTQPISPSPDLSRLHVLAFDYFSTTGTNLVQVFLDPPLREASSVTGPGLSRSEGWSGYALDLQSAWDKSHSVRTLRIDLGSQANKRIQIRSLLLRSLSPQERNLAVRREANRASEKQRENRLRDYLARKYPCRVTQVMVTNRQIKVSGTRGIVAPHALFLAQIPLWADVTEVGLGISDTKPLQTDTQGHFSQTMKRRSPQNGGPSPDELLCRWAVVRKTTKGWELLSQARYSDTVEAQTPLLPEEKPRNKKGVGGFSADRPLSDVDDLGLSAATVNIVLNGLFATTPGQGRTPFVYGSRTWYADDAQIARLDKTIGEAAKHHLVVSAIVLVGQAGSAPVGSFSRLIACPDADPAGIFVMPNVAEKNGLLAYAASLDFLAKRYSRTDNRWGRIHHWILHNEVNAGWVWTNAGDKTELLYMDLYQRSLRTAYLIARQYDSHAKVFISLEHHWTMIASAHFYAGKSLLERLGEFSRAEGDFEWGIAFHPYPQNLFDPHVWADTEVNFTFDTPKITFKNLEVLDAWVKRPFMRYQGKVRTVHLSEQGLNSRDYTPNALRDQAAGMAYAWNKFKNLNSIEVFHYHNWVDNRGEGGLRIGLRRFPDDADEPLGRKPIWFVYQSLGTDTEAAVTAPYQSVVGVEDWAQVRHTAPIPQQKGQ